MVFKKKLGRKVKIEQFKQPREFFIQSSSGLNKLYDCAHIILDPNEQITFVTNDGSQYDFACKEWGFYATPSINVRLKKEGFKTALVKNGQGKLYVMVVESSKLLKFKQYLEEDNQTILEWLDEHSEK